MELIFITDIHVAVYVLSSARQVTNYRSEWILCIYVVNGGLGMEGLMTWKCEFNDLYMSKSYSIGGAWRLRLWCWRTTLHAIEMLSILKIESVWAINYIGSCIAIANAWRFQREAIFIKMPNEWPPVSLCVNNVYEWRRHLLLYH